MISTETIAMPAQPEFWLPLIWIAGMAFLFALLEIQIEGSHGWAANLPTWRLPPASKLRWLFGGRPLAPDWIALAVLFLLAAGSAYLAGRLVLRNGSLLPAWYAHGGGNLLATWFWVFFR